ncbi:MAG: hypothetical protein ACJ77K_09110 [Bacteroidia bacterium]
MADKKNKKRIDPGKKNEQEPVPNKPEKNVPVKKDDDNDHTSPKPGITDPKRTDPTRIDEPEKTDPTRKE